jgi:CDP-glucose 4,6-dehydratase
MLNFSNVYKNRKVLITGHTGFKGTWLSIFLNMFNAQIYGYSLKPQKISLFNQTKTLYTFNTCEPDAFDL